MEEPQEMVYTSVVLQVSVKTELDLCPRMAETQAEQLSSVFPSLISMAAFS